MLNKNVLKLLSYLHWWDFLYDQRSFDLKIILNMMPQVTPSGCLKYSRDWNRHESLNSPNKFTPTAIFQSIVRNSPNSTINKQHLSSYEYIARSIHALNYKLLPYTSYPRPLTGNCVQTPSRRRATVDVAVDASHAADAWDKLLKSIRFTTSILAWYTL